MPLPHHLSTDPERAQLPFAPESLPPEQSTEVRAIAEAVKRAGMQAPAALLLNTVKPLAWAGGQMLWMLQPFIEAFGLGKRTGITVPGLATLLEQEGTVDRLLEQIDTDTPPTAGPGNLWKA